MDYGRAHFERYQAVAFPKYSMHWWSNRFYAKLIQRYAKGGRLLEIGCGTGFFLAELSRYFETYGVDISPFALSHARANCPQANLLFLRAEDLVALRPAFFDAVVLRHVLEHLEDPGLVVSEAARLLRSGGLLFYVVPNMSVITRRWKGRKWYAYQDETHISLLHPQEWLRLTEEAGLKVQKAYSDGLWDVPYVPLVPNLVQKLIFGAPGGLQALLGLSFLPISWGESLIVIARKP